MEEEQRLKRKMNEKKAKQEAERLYKVRPTYCHSRLNSCQNLFLFLCVQKKFMNNFLVMTISCCKKVPACCESQKILTLQYHAPVLHKNHLTGIEPSLQFISLVLHVQSVVIL